MAHIVFVSLLGAWFFSTPLAAREVAGVKLDDQVQLGATPLVLNGAGVRSKFFVKVYVGALYLGKPSKSVTEILEMSGPKRIAMHFLHDEVSEEKLLEAWNEGFENNQTEEILSILRPKIEQFNKLFQTVQTGDVITLDYIPDEGTAVVINGLEKGKVPEADFNRALLLIWLGDKPADEDLKQALLGQ